jgi:hypothetical protein
LSETIDLDLGVYWGLVRIEQKTIHDVHERLKEIGDTLKRWKVPAGDGLLVLSVADVERQRKEWLSRLTGSAGEAEGEETHDAPS